MSILKQKGTYPDQPKPVYSYEYSYEDVTDDEDINLTYPDEPVIISTKTPKVIKEPKHQPVVEAKQKIRTRPPKTKKQLEAFAKCRQKGIEARSRKAKLREEAERLLKEEQLAAKEALKEKREREKQRIAKIEAELAESRKTIEEINGDKQRSQKLSTLEDEYDSKKNKEINDLKDYIEVEQNKEPVVMTHAELAAMLYGGNY